MITLIAELVLYAGGAMMIAGVVGRLWYEMSSRRLDAQERMMLEQKFKRKYNID